MSASVGKKIISEDDLVDLHGKVAIVTGGNTGIGYGTIQFLARKGAKVYMASRNQEKALEAIKQLEKEDIKEGSVHWLKLDLSDPRLARSSAEEVMQKENRLDILVNNAATGANGPYQINKDGLLDIITTNHVSHFVFTETLMPLLRKTAEEDGSDVRIVNVSSMAHAQVRVDSFVGKDTINKDYGNSFNGYLNTYGLSKLANILHIKTLQRKLDAESIPITCIALHPGAVKTVGSSQFLNGVPYLPTFISKIVSYLLFIPLTKGAMTSAFAAAGKDVKKDRATYKGVYMVPYGKVVPPSKEAMDERLANELWETTQSVIADLK